MAPNRRLPAAVLCATMLLPVACEAAPVDPAPALTAALTSARATDARRSPDAAADQFGSQVTAANQAARDDQGARRDHTTAGGHGMTSGPTDRPDQRAAAGRPAGTPLPTAGTQPPATRTALPTAPPASAALLGAAPETLRRWLGDPSLRRPEGTAEIWLYLAPACALDIILYRTGAGLRVAHAAARANGADPPTEPACLDAIARAATTARQHS